MCRPACQIVLALALLLPACAGPPAPAAAWLAGGDAYTFDRPDTTVDLPGRLREISGLTVLDDRHLGAVQDEAGRFYVLDRASGRPVREVTFGPAGDYEGIERVDRRLFILRSDGALFEVADWQADRPGDARRHETGLAPGCDAEGLAYQPDLGRLLIACKEDAGPRRDRHKAIFAFDLATGRTAPAPAYTLDVAAFTRSLPDDNAVDDRLRALLAPLVDLSGLKPSALAVHPVTGQVFVLSSARRAVVALDPGGAVAGVWALPEILFRQPEALAFLPGGDLLVASEGGGGDPARLFRFRYHADSTSSTSSPSSSH